MRALYNAHPPADELKKLAGVEWLRCDLLDVFAVEEVMTGVTDVYHCAAIVSFDSRRHNEMLHFNPVSTANIVNQAIVQGIRKMVYVSSVAALGRTGNTKGEISEEAEWENSKFNSAYAVSKYLAEMEVWRGIGEGLNVAIVNPGIILGSGTGHDLSAQLMKMVYYNFPFYSKGVNSWVGATDVVNAMVMLMNNDINEERFILSTGNFSYKEIFTMMAASLHKKPPRFPINSLMTGIGWRASVLLRSLFGIKTVITKETARNANAYYYYDNRKLLSALPGFSYIPLAQTIDAMARSFERSYGRQ